MLNINHLKVLEKICKRKEGIPDAYKIDKIDVDSYFFYIFFDIFTKSNRITQFSKGLEYATFSTKKNLNMRSLLRNKFILRIACKQIRIVVHFELWPLFFEAVHKYFTKKFFSSPRPNNNIFFTTEYFNFYYYNDYNVVGVQIRFGIRLPNAYIQKLDSKNGTFSKNDLKFFPNLDLNFSSSRNFRLNVTFSLKSSIFGYCSLIG